MGKEILKKERLEIIKQAIWNHLDEIARAVDAEYQAMGIPKKRKKLDWDMEKLPVQESKETD